jgi:hypothetical protein
MPGRSPPRARANLYLIPSPTSPPQSTVSLKDFVRAYCPKAPAVSQATVNFTGVSAADFTAKIAPGVGAAIAKIGKVAAAAVGAPAVTAVGKVGAPRP